MAGQNPQAVANLLRNIYESEQYQTNAPAPFQRQGFAITNWLGLTGRNSVLHQLAGMYDPRSRAGLVNLAAMFAGGGFEGKDIIGPEVPGAKVVPYRLEQSPVRMHEGQPYVRVGRKYGPLNEMKAAYKPTIFKKMLGPILRNALPESPVARAKAEAFQARLNNRGQIPNGSIENWHGIMGENGSGHVVIRSLPKSLIRDILEQAARHNHPDYGAPEQMIDYLPNFHDTAHPGADLNTAFGRIMYPEEISPHLPKFYRRYARQKMEQTNNNFEWARYKHEGALQARADQAREVAKHLNQHELSVAQEGQGRFRDRISNNNFFRQEHHNIIPEHQAENARIVRQNDFATFHQLHGAYEDQIPHIMEHPLQTPKGISAARRSALERLMARQRFNRHN